MAKFDAKETLKRIKKRREEFRKRKATGTIEGISPEVIQAVKNLDKLKSTSKNKDPGTLLFSPDRDFILMLRDYREIHGCSGAEAHRQISKLYPAALERLITEANR